MLKKPKKGGVFRGLTHTMSFEPVGNGLYRITTVYTFTIKMPEYIKLAWKQKLYSEEIEFDCRKAIELDLRITRNLICNIEIKRLNTVSGEIICVLKINAPYDKLAAKLFTTRVSESYKDMRDVIRSAWIEYIEKNKLKYRIARRGISRTGYLFPNVIPKK